MYSDKVRNMVDLFEIKLDEYRSEKYVHVDSVRGLMVSRNRTTMVSKVSINHTMIEVMIETTT